MPYVVDAQNLSYTYGGASTAGALPRWFVNTFLGKDSAAEYKEIEEQIIESNVPPGSDGLIVLPYYMGERTPIWDPNATGVFFGMTLAHGKSHMYHAILESVAYSLRDIMDSMKTEEKEPDKIVLVGGGIKSLVWKQIFANVIGLPVYTPVNPVEATLGDAYLAAYADEVVPDFNEILKWIEFNEPVLPDMEKHKRYDKFFEIYKELYRNLKDTMKKRADILNDLNS